MLPVQAALGDSDDDEDDCANRKDSGCEFDDTLPCRGAKQSAKAAAEEEVICAGKGGGVDEVLVAKVRMHGDESDTNAKDEHATDERYTQERLGTLEFVDEKRPDEIELLFHLKRPEVIDVDVG